MCLYAHTHWLCVLGWGVGFSPRHWGPEIALELHYLRAVAAEAESREEKNQSSPGAPLSASTPLCPHAGAIPLFLFLPSVLPNKSTHKHTPTPQLAASVQLSVSSSCCPKTWLHRGHDSTSPNTRSLVHIIIHTAVLAIGSYLQHHPLQCNFALSVEQPVGIYLKYHLVVFDIVSAQRNTGDWSHDTLYR